MAVTSISHSVVPRFEEPGVRPALHNDDGVNGQINAFAAYKPPETVSDAAARLPRDSRPRMWSGTPTSRLAARAIRARCSRGRICIGRVWAPGMKRM